MYYAQTIRDSGQQHPVTCVRQRRSADWREIEPHLEKLNAQLMLQKLFSFLAPAISLTKFFIRSSCKRAATSRGMNHSLWTPNLKPAKAQGWRSLHRCASPALSSCGGAGEPEAYVQVTYRVMQVITQNGHFPWTIANTVLLTVKAGSCSIRPVVSWIVRWTQSSQNPDDYPGYP